MLCTFRARGVYRPAAALAAALCLSLPAAAYAQPDLSRPWQWPGMPDGVSPPMFHPAGVELETRQVGEGVYALVSNRPPADNVGFIVGDRGVLVIDAHINAAMARKIIDAVRAVTDKPILYVVNTNYHGDHTFGNYAFPATTMIVAHRETAKHMRDHEHELAVILTTVRGDEQVLADVRLRLPDVVFTDFMRIDLGGRVVELHHFGPASSDGDVVVYEPASRTAFTGNFITGGGVPVMLDNGAVSYLRAVARMRATLDLSTIIPGHLPPPDVTVLGDYLTYCSELVDAVRAALRVGKSEAQVLAEAEAPARLRPPADVPRAEQRWRFLQGLHKVNVASTYRELAAQ